MKKLTYPVALTLMLSLIACSGQNSDIQQQDSTNEHKNVNKSIIKSPDFYPVGMPAEAMVASKVMRQFSQPMHYSSQPIFIAPASNKENYQQTTKNPLQITSEQPISTFSVDVDSGSYSNMRRMLSQGVLPPNDALRTEELINYFDYQIDTPKNSDIPFSINTEMMVSPWNADRMLLKIALKAYEIPKADIGAANLVFLLDVSGSMNAANKLPLLKKSLIMLSKQLEKHDRVSIVVYAGAAGIVLEACQGNDLFSITQALNSLKAGGSTHGSQGIELAYQLAQKSFIKGGINRVILATDGDFNVGTTNIDTLKELIEKKRNQGINLTTLGFGQGNYNDHLMEQLADIGNGNYAYIDNINEARKVLVDEISSTLHIVAKDVKIQVEFNPDQVAQYRLLGYENRLLKREDFNNDKVDAGEIGAGHDVTAIYELTMIDANNKTIDDLRYKTPPAATVIKSAEIAIVKLRYKQPTSEKSQLITRIIRPSLLNNKGSENFKFASAVAAFAQLLKGGKYLENYNFQDIIKLAQNNKGKDDFGYRAQFIQLVRTAASLQTPLVSNNKDQINRQVK